MNFIHDFDNKGISIQICEPSRDLYLFANMMPISSICSASGRRRATCSASNSLADNPFDGEQRPLRLRLRRHKIRKSLRRVEKCALRSALRRTVRIGLMAGFYFISIGVNANSNNLGYFAAVLMTALQTRINFRSGT